MKILGIEPFIHPDAVVIDSKLGVWTEVQAHSQVTESELGDYSYVTQNCRVHWATIGKFVNIASFARINPGNHPTWRNHPAPTSPTVPGNTRWERMTQTFSTGAGNTG